jgi:dihydroxyacid dehydratase/phosphogluconate dehydratase
MKKPEELRSHRWFGRDTMRSFNHRSRMAQLGNAESDYRGKPVIAILNTWSEINPCHMHFRQRVEEVKRGVWQAGGFPLEMPAMSIAEIFSKPSPLMYRNFLAMETEELLRSYPADGAVLMGGCDKTTPGLVMGATSMGLPFIFMPAGPMLRGSAGGKTLGSGTDMFKGWAQLRAGEIDQGEWQDIMSGIARSPGTCMTMGTAATMMSACEALGLTLPGASSIPAPDSRHAQMATATGKRIVEMVWEDLVPHEDHDRRLVRERGHVRARHGRLHQRADPPHRHGAPRRLLAGPRSLRRARAHHAAHRQHPPGGEIPHGGFLLCRRAARAAGAQSAASSIRRRSRSTAGRWARTSPARRSSTTT